jgi:hypothetical protein
MTCCDATVMVGDVAGDGRCTSATADAQWHVLSVVCETAIQSQAANTCNSGSI